MLGAMFVSALGFPGLVQAASISPDTDTSALFNVIAKREMTVGTDPRMDLGVAVQTSYFEFREAALTVRPSGTPFAPEMPQVAPREVAILPLEEITPINARRYR